MPVDRIYPINAKIKLEAPIWIVLDVPNIQVKHPEIKINCQNFFINCFSNITNGIIN